MTLDLWAYHRHVASIPLATGAALDFDNLAHLIGEWFGTVSGPAIVVVTDVRPDVTIHAVVATRGRGQP